MSYIDLFKHEVTGEVFGLPVYKALEKIDGDEFVCEKNQYIIGGGGGEHPAIVISDFFNAIVTALSYEKDDWCELRDLNPEENLKFFDWAISTYVAFDKLARENGFNEDEYSSIEIWINVEIGRMFIEMQKKEEGK